MDAVKIKRVKRNKKKISTKEKILAGFGLGTSILGGGMGVAGKTPATRVVSEKTMSSDSATAKAKAAISRVFKLQSAQASEDEGLLALDGNPVVEEKPVDAVSEQELPDIQQEETTIEQPQSEPEAVTETPVAVPAQEPESSPEPESEPEPAPITEAVPAEAPEAVPEEPVNPNIDQAPIADVPEIPAAENPELRPRGLTSAEPEQLPQIDPVSISPSTPEALVISEPAQSQTQDSAVNKVLETNKSWDELTDQEKSTLVDYFQSNPDAVSQMTNISNPAILYMLGAGNSQDQTAQDRMSQFGYQTAGDGSWVKKTETDITSQQQTQAQNQGLNLTKPEDLLSYAASHSYGELTQEQRQQVDNLLKNSETVLPPVALGSYVAQDKALGDESKYQGTETNKVAEQNAEKQGFIEGQSGDLVNVNQATITTTTDKEGNKTANLILADGTELEVKKDNNGNLVDNSGKVVLPITSAPAVAAALAKGSKKDDVPLQSLTKNQSVDEIIGSDKTWDQLSADEQKIVTDYFKNNPERLTELNTVSSPILEYMLGVGNNNTDPSAIARAAQFGYAPNPSGAGWVKQSTAQVKTNQEQQIQTSGLDLNKTTDLLTYAGQHGYGELTQEQRDQIDTLMKDPKIVLPPIGLGSYLAQVQSLGDKSQYQDEQTNRLGAENAETEGFITGQTGNMVNVNQAKIETVKNENGSTTATMTLSDGTELKLTQDRKGNLLDEKGNAVTVSNNGDIIDKQGNVVIPGTALIKLADNLGVKGDANDEPGRELRRKTMTQRADPSNQEANPQTQVVEKDGGFIHQTYDEKTKTWADAPSAGDTRMKDGAAQVYQNGVWVNLSAITSSATTGATIKLNDSQGNSYSVTYKTTSTGEVQAELTINGQKVVVRYGKVGALQADGSFQAFDGLPQEVVDQITKNTPKNFSINNLSSHTPLYASLMDQQSATITIGNANYNLANPEIIKDARGNIISVSGTDSGFGAMQFYNVGMGWMSSLKDSTQYSIVTPGGTVALQNVTVNRDADGKPVSISGQVGGSAAGLSQGTVTFSIGATISAVSDPSNINVMTIAYTSGGYDTQNLVINNGQVIAIVNGGGAQAYNYIKENNLVGVAPVQVKGSSAYAVGTGSDTDKKVLYFGPTGIAATLEGSGAQAVGFTYENNITNYNIITVASGISMVAYTGPDGQVEHKFFGTSGQLSGDQIITFSNSQTSANPSFLSGFFSLAAGTVNFSLGNNQFSSNDPSFIQHLYNSIQANGSGEASAGGGNILGFYLSPSNLQMVVNVVNQQGITDDFAVNYFLENNIISKDSQGQYSLTESAQSKGYLQTGIMEEVNTHEALHQSFFTDPVLHDQIIDWFGNLTPAQQLAGLSMLEARGYHNAGVSSDSSNSEGYSMFISELYSYTHSNPTNFNIDQKILTDQGDLQTMVKNIAAAAQQQAEKDMADPSLGMKGAQIAVAVSGNMVVLQVNDVFHVWQLPPNTSVLDPSINNFTTVTVSASDVDQNGKVIPTQLRIQKNDITFALDISDPKNTGLAAAQMAGIVIDLPDLVKNSAGQVLGIQGKNQEGVNLIFAQNGQTLIAVSPDGSSATLMDKNRNIIALITNPKTETDEDGNIIKVSGINAQGDNVVLNVGNYLGNMISARNPNTGEFMQAFVDDKGQPVVIMDDRGVHFVGGGSAYDAANSTINTDPNNIDFSDPEQVLAYLHNLLDLHDEEPEDGDIGK